MRAIKAKLKNFTKTDAFMVNKHGLICEKKGVVTDFGSISDLPSGIERTGRLVLLERPEQGVFWKLSANLHDVIDMYDGDLPKCFQIIGYGESSVIQWAIKLKGKPNSLEEYEALFELMQEAARLEETCDGNDIVVWDKKNERVIKIKRFPVKWFVPERGGVICQLGVLVD